MKKRILSMLVVIAMVVGLLPAIALAAEENTDPAVIDGMSITIDGVEYNSSNTSADNPAVITPNTQSIILTAYGTNLQNGTADNWVFCGSNTSVYLEPGFWNINPDGTTATCDLSGYNSHFASTTTAFEMKYSNEGNAVSVFVGSGVYVVYDTSAGSEEPTEPAVITGVSITVDGVTYTEGNVSITPETQSIIYTVTGTNFTNVSADNSLSYTAGVGSALNDGSWTIDTEANTATQDFSNKIIWFESCDNFEVKYSNDGNATRIGTGIYLTYDDGIAEEDKAQITGVSITVDGETYTEGNVNITPTSTIVFTVAGTNFANVSADNFLQYAPSYSDSLNSGWFAIDTEANTATWDFSDRISVFGSCDHFEVAYSNDGQQSWTGTGIYLTYVRPVPDSTGKIVVDMADYYSDSWNGAAIEIYKNGVLETTATVDKDFNTVSLDYDSAASYEFKWVRGQYDSECSFTIYVDGETKLEVSGASGYENGETILTLGDVTTEPDQPTESAVITGVSITVDGMTYTEGNVTITPNTQSVIFTITGTNFANLSNDNKLSATPLGTVSPLTILWITDTAANTATVDFSEDLDILENCDHFEVTYSNGEQTWIGTGIYLTYEETPAGPQAHASLDFNKVGLNLGASIGVQFALETSAGAEGEFDKVYVKVAMDLYIDGVATEQVYTLENFMLQDSLLVFEHGVAPKLMGRAMTVQAFGEKDGVVYYGTAQEYSIKQGILERLEATYPLIATDEKEAQLATLLVDMLYYGAAAQKKFGQTGYDGLVTAGLDAKYVALATTTVPTLDATLTTELGTVNEIYGYNLGLSDAVEMQLTFTLEEGEHEKYTVQITCGENVYTYGYVDFRYAYGASYPNRATVIIRDLAAKQMRDEVTIVLLKDGVQVSQTYTVSIEGIAAPKVDANTELVQAMMRYGDSAAAYFG